MTIIREIIRALQACTDQGQYPSKLLIPLARAYELPEAQILAGRVCGHPVEWTESRKIRAV